MARPSRVGPARGQAKASLPASAEPRLPMPNLLTSDRSPVGMSLRDRARSLLADPLDKDLLALLAR